MSDREFYKGAFRRPDPKTDPPKERSKNPLSGGLKSEYWSVTVKIQTRALEPIASLNADIVQVFFLGGKASAIAYDDDCHPEQLRHLARELLAVADELENDL